MRISDWSSDVCSSDLPIRFMIDARSSSDLPLTFTSPVLPFGATLNPSTGEFNWTPTYIQDGIYEIPFEVSDGETTVSFTMTIDVLAANAAPVFDSQNGWQRSEAHTSELQSLMRISYAVICMKKKIKLNMKNHDTI